MKKFYTGTTKHPKLIMALFAICFVVCLLIQNLVEVNYDMNDYLPKDAKSTIALDVMKAESQTPGLW